MSVYKVDSIGTRKDGAGGDTSNTSQGNARFVRLYAKEDLNKGEAVAFDLATTTDGKGIYVKKADGNATDAANTTGLRQAIGIVAETIDLNAANDPELVIVQVSGLCDFAILDATGDVVPGDLLQADADAGELTVYDVSGSAHPYVLPLGMLVTEGTNATADSTIILFNPANL